jgi:hypothetical protein
MTFWHHIANQAWFLKTISSHEYEERRIEVYDMAFFISHAISTLDPY